MTNYVYNSLLTVQKPNTPPMNTVLSTAMTSTKAYDGTEAVGTAMALIYTADATNGGVLPKAKVLYTGVNGAAPSGTTAATVLHFFLNNGGANTSAANNQLIGRLKVPAQNMANIADAPELAYDFYNMMIPPGHKIYCGNTIAVGGTSCGLAPSMPGGGDF